MMARQHMSRALPSLRGALAPKQSRAGAPLAPPPRQALGIATPQARLAMTNRLTFDIKDSKP